MTAIVRFKSYENTKISYEFHVGSKAHQPHFNDVVSLYCDGHELDLACMILGRDVMGRAYTFVGDSAKEIVANWR